MEILGLEAPSAGRVALGNPHMVATLPGATVEELAEEDLAEGCP